MNSRMHRVAGVAGPGHAGRPIRPFPRRAPGQRPGDDPGHRAGFTLVELMVAVLLLSVGIMGVAQVLAVADRHTAYARTETIAVSLAQEIREKILSQNFDNVHTLFHHVDTSSPSTVPATAAAWATHVATGLGATGRGQVQVDSSADNAQLPPGLLNITITLSWRELGHTVSVPLQFMLAKTTA